MLTLEFFAGLALGLSLWLAFLFACVCVLATLAVLVGRDAPNVSDGMMEVAFIPWQDNSGDDWS